MAEVIGYVFAVLFFNGLLSLLVAYVAGQKGRSAAGFFWLSFFTSFLIGILVAIAVPRVEKSAPNQAASHTGRVAPTSSGISVKCPFCAEWVSSEAKACKHCGREIENEVRAAIEAEREAEISALQADSVRAAEAQAELARAQEEKSRKRKEFRGSRRFKALIASSIVLVVLAVGGSIIASYLAEQDRVAREDNWTQYEAEINRLTTGPMTLDRFESRARDALWECDVTSTSTFTFELRDFPRQGASWGDLYLDKASLSTGAIDCVTLLMVGAPVSEEPSSGAGLGDEWFLTDRDGRVRVSWSTF